VVTIAAALHVAAHSVNHRRLRGRSHRGLQFGGVVNVMLLMRL